MSTCSYVTDRTTEQCDWRSDSGYSVLATQCVIAYCRVSGVKVNKYSNQIWLKNCRTHFWHRSKSLQRDSQCEWMERPRDEDVSTFIEWTAPYRLVCVWSGGEESLFPRWFRNSVCFSVQSQRSTKLQCCNSVDSRMVHEDACTLGNRQQMQCLQWSKWTIKLPNQTIKQQILMNIAEIYSTTTTNSSSV